MGMSAALPIADIPSLSIGNRFVAKADIKINQYITRYNALAMSEGLP
jgi:hypothetical protein